MQAFGENLTPNMWSNNPMQKLGLDLVHQNIPMEILFFIYRHLGYSSINDFSQKAVFG